MSTGRLNRWSIAEEFADSSQPQLPGAFNTFLWWFNKHMLLLSGPCLQDWLITYKQPVNGWLMRTVWIIAFPFYCLTRNDAKWDCLSFFGVAQNGKLLGFFFLALGGAQGEEPAVPSQNLWGEMGMCASQKLQQFSLSLGSFSLLLNSKNSVKPNVIWSDIWNGNGFIFPFWE